MGSKSLTCWLEREAEWPLYSRVVFTVESILPLKPWPHMLDKVDLITPSLFLVYLTRHCWARGSQTLWNSFQSYLAKDLHLFISERNSCWALCIPGDCRTQHCPKRTSSLFTCCHSGTTDRVRCASNEFVTQSGIKEKVLCLCYGSLLTSKLMRQIFESCM